MIDSFFDARSEMSDECILPRHRKKFTDEAFFASRKDIFVWQREKTYFSTDLFIALPQQPSALQTKRRQLRFQRKKVGDFYL